MTRVIVADDHTLFRIGLRQMLESFDGVSVVAEAANATQTLDVAQNVAADLLISDLTMPGTVGTQASASPRPRPATTANWRAAAAAPPVRLPRRRRLRRSHRRAPTARPSSACNCASA
jgi:DNA-binding NarL/FixJ family response regulator